MYNEYSYSSNFIFQQAHNHHSLLVKMLADSLNCQPTDIMDFELCLADAFPAVRDLLLTLASYRSLC